MHISGSKGNVNPNKSFQVNQQGMPPTQERDVKEESDLRKLPVSQPPHMLRSLLKIRDTGSFIAENLKSPEQESMQSEPELDQLGVSEQEMFSLESSLEPSNELQAGRRKLTGWTNQPPEVLQLSNNSAVSNTQGDTSDVEVSKVLEEETKEALAPIIAEDIFKFDEALAQLKAEDRSKFDEALAPLIAEDRSKLDTVQEIWNKIATSNTQEITSYVMGKLATPMSQLAMLWTLKHVGTLFLDILDGSDGDRRSARRMMFLEPKKTIDLYNSLTKKWSSSSEDERKISLVTKGSFTYFETTEGARTEIQSSDIITGLTVEKFRMLFLTNREDAIKLAEVVGGYVWKNSPRIGTPAGREAVRRIKEDIEEGIKLLKDVINLVSDIYSIFNPVWATMQAVIALGDILTTGEL